MRKALKLMGKEEHDKLISQRKIDGSKYTLERRLEIVRMLQESGFDYKLIQGEVNVCQATLKRWYLLYKDYLENGDYTELALKKVDASLAKRKTDFINTHFGNLSKLMDASIQRAMTLVAEEEDLNKVNNTIKVISEFVTKMDGKDGNSANPNSNISVLVKQTIERVNQTYIAAGKEKAED